MTVKVHQYILAAGLSSRFGSNKALATLEGVPLVIRTIRACLDEHPMTLVLGHEREAIEKALLAFNFLRSSASYWQCGITGQKLEILHNKGYHFGLQTSIRLSLQHALSTPPVEGLRNWIFFTTMDLAFLQERDVKDYEQAIRQNLQAEYIHAFYGPSVGIPTALSFKAASDFLREPGNKTLKNFLARNNKAVYIDKPHLSFDIDYKYQLREISRLGTISRYLLSFRHRLKERPFDTCKKNSSVFMPETNLSKKDL